MWLKGHSSANDGSKMLEDKKELASILRQTKMTINTSKLMLCNKIRAI
jgi:hypothetical protein